MHCGKTAAKLRFDKRVAAQIQPVFSVFRARNGQNLSGGDTNVKLCEVDYSKGLGSTY